MDLLAGGLTCSELQCWGGGWKGARAYEEELSCLSSGKGSRGGFFSDKVLAEATVC